MTTPVRPVSPADQAWADLASELRPAKSLARVDAVTARAITTITIIGVLITGLGTISAGQLSKNPIARDLAVAAVAAASLAIACALFAQVLTVSRGLNPANLAAVKAWYERQFNTRAYPTQVATILVLVAALLAGAAAVISLLSS